MESATVTITAAFISAVLTTSALAAEPADNVVREADKEHGHNEETESEKGTRKDHEQLEAEQGSCGSD